MAITGMTGIWPAAFGNLADPVQSALRTVLANGGNTVNSAVIINNVNASGAGTVMTAYPNGAAYGQGMYYLSVSGNSASAAWQGSPDGALWFQITSTAQGPGTTGFGQWSGFYPYIRGTVLWSSAGNNLTGTVYSVLVLK